MICWDISDGAPALDSSGHFSSIEGAGSPHVRCLMTLEHATLAITWEIGNCGQQKEHTFPSLQIRFYVGKKDSVDFLKLDNWYEECQTFWFEHFSRRYQVIIVRLGRDRNMMILVPCDIQQFTSNKYSAILNAVQCKSDGKG